MNRDITGKVHPYAYRYLPIEEQEIGKYYSSVYDIYDTAETYHVDIDKVVEIAEKLKYYSDSKHRHKRVFSIRDYLD